TKASFIDCGKDPRVAYIFFHNREDLEKAFNTPVEFGHLTAYDPRNPLHNPPKPTYKVLLKIIQPKNLNYDSLKLLLSKVKEVLSRFKNPISVIDLDPPGRNGYFFI